MTNLSFYYSSSNENFIDRPPYAHRYRQRSSFWSKMK